MLNDVGILRSDCYLTYAHKTYCTRGDTDTLFSTSRTAALSKGHIEHAGRYAAPELLASITQLKAELTEVQPECIIALGDLALWCLTGESGIGKWRGSQMFIELNGRQVPVLPTYTPAVVCRKWEWRSVVLQDLRRLLQWRKAGFPPEPSYSFTINPSLSDTLDFLSDIEAAAASGPVKLAVDIETKNREIECIGFARDVSSAFCIPILSMERAEGHWSVDDEWRIVRAIRRVLSHPMVSPIGQNYAYDMYYTAVLWGIHPHAHHDTMLMHHVLFPGTQKGLDYLSSMYCNFHYFWKDEGKEMDKHYSEERRWTYNCKDARTTFEISEVLESVIKHQKMEDQYAFQMQRMLRALRATLRGVRIDRNLKAAASMQLLEAIASREQWLADMLGHPVNPRSPKQLQQIFYTDFGLKPIKARAKKGVPGGVTTNTEALEKIADREPILRPICNTLVELRSLGVFNSTFIQAPLDEDGRIRCAYNAAGTETFRFSSSSNPMGTGTNLQNVPKGNE